MLRGIANFILGVHPNNTMFSYNWHNVRHINAFIAKHTVGIESGSVIADIGGGKSPYYFHLANKVSEYIVIDFKESLPCKEERKITQLEGVAESIPLVDNSVDVALCNQVLEHVIEPQKALEEIFRILKPGGCCIGSVPHVSPIHLEPYDFWRFTSLGLSHLLNISRFNKIAIEGNGGVFSAAAVMISMDLLLNKRKDYHKQQFKAKTSVIVAPFVGLMNISALLADTIAGDRLRTPANLCWIAYKPID